MKVATNRKWNDTLALVETNKAALMIASMLTSDGMTLGGFASTRDALKYDYTSPLKWWPAVFERECKAHWTS